MKLKYLPFSIIPLNKLSKGAHMFLGLSMRLKKIFPYLDLDIKQAKIDIKVENYLSLCMFASSIFFIIVGFLLFIILKIVDAKTELNLFPIPTTLVTIFLLTIFVLFQQLNYPKLLKNRRIHNLEHNLLHGLRNILVQVSAGVPIFNVFVTIANGDYGEISNEFKVVVKEISAGKPQAEALKELTANNPSIFFRRAMWQLANGMKAGSDVAHVIEEIIKTISEEQLVQIRTYGSQLNPIAMFYMLLTVIVPALSITLLIILSSFLGFSEKFTMILFAFLYCIVTFMQLMFLGLIKTKRPSLMGE